MDTPKATYRVQNGPWAVSYKREGEARQAMLDVASLPTAAGEARERTVVLFYVPGDGTPAIKLQTMFRPNGEV